MDTLSHDTRALAVQIPLVKQDVEGLQLQSGVMSELSLLEVVQERIQQTLDIFDQATQWNAQVDESIRFQIESGAYEVADSRIAGLRELVGVWEGTVEYKERVERIQSLEKALASAMNPVIIPAALTMGGAQRGGTRAQSRLRVDSSESVLRDSDGIFGKLRQNVGR